MGIAGIWIYLVASMCPVLPTTLVGIDKDCSRLDRIAFFFLLMSKRKGNFFLQEVCMWLMLYNVVVGLHWWIGGIGVQSCVY